MTLGRLSMCVLVVFNWSLMMKHIIIHYAYSPKGSLASKEKDR